MPRVFISYSWDSDEHKDRVRALATFLRRNGIEARLDQWEEGTPPDGWPAWCSRQVLKADVIVVICTKRYHERFHGLESRRPGGVIWESQTIQNLAYFHYLRAGFLPVILNDTDGEYVPACVLGAVVQPLVWPTDGDWSGSGILDRLEPLRTTTPRLPLPIPEPSTKLIHDGAQQSVISDSVWEDIARIQHRLDVISEQLQQPYRLNLDRPDLVRSDAHDPSIHNLRYRERWLDFQSRPELVQLRQWVDDPPAFSWWAVIAPGGTGKSRLALELIHSLDGGLWHAGFLTDGGSANWLVDKCNGWRPQRPTLIVVDYATAKQEAVIKGLETLSHTLREEAGFPRVRLLLLDRSAGFTPGFALHNQAFRDWDTIRDRVRDYRHKRESMPRPEKRSATEALPLVEPEELLNLQDPPREEWKAILTAVIRKATPPGAVPVTIDNLTVATWWDHVARLTAGGRMLYLEILGVVLACNPQFITGSAGPAGTGDLLDAMLNRERDVRWVKDWPPSLPCPTDWVNSSELTALTRAIGFATLVRGIRIAAPKDWQPFDEATQLPRRWRRALSVYLRVDTITPPPNAKGQQLTSDIIQPLEPDLLGERLLLRLSSPSGTGMDARSADVSPASWIGPAFRCNAMGTAQTLNLLVDDFPDHPATHDWVNEAVKHLTNQFTAAGLKLRIDFRAFAAVASAVSKLATRAGFAAECSRNLLTLAAVSENIRASLLVGFVSQSKQSCRLSNQAWDDLALTLAWGTAFRDFSNQFLVYTLTMSVFEEYLGDWRLDQIERWTLAIRKIAGTHSPGHSFLIKLGYDPVNAITVYGRAGQFLDLERSGAMLTLMAAANPEATEIQLRLAQGALNAIGCYGRAGQFRDVERWGTKLTNLATANPEATGIQLQLAQGAFNAIEAYGTVRQFPDLERWGTTLTNLTTANPEATGIQLQLAQGAVNAINHYGTAGKFSDLERWGTKLTDLAAANPEATEIQLELAKGVFNAITLYGRAGQFPALERWGAKVTNMAAANPAATEIQRRVALCALNAIGCYGIAGQFPDVERWGATLTNLAASSPAATEIQIESAKVAFNAISHYGTAGEIPDLERWGATLVNLAATNPAATEIQLELVKAAIIAIKYYGTASQFPGLERWGTTLAGALERSPITPDFMSASLGIAGELFKRSPQGGTYLFVVFLNYWPGFMVPFDQNQEAPLCISLPDLLSDPAQNHHRKLLAKAYSLAEPFSKGDVQTVADALPLLRELWPLRMYLPDRGDAFVWMLRECGLDELVGEAARDPWRRAADPSGSGN